MEARKKSAYAATAIGAAVLTGRGVVRMPGLMMPADKGAVAYVWVLATESWRFYFRSLLFVEFVYISGLCLYD